MIAVSETHLTVRTADGPIEITRTDVVAAKRVPDQRARSATERLELITAQGWPAPETARLGDWLLRASYGWTNRGNSALAVGDPGRPVPAAVDAVVDWYHARGLPASITVPEPLGRRVRPELRRRAWATRPRTLVQTAPLDALVSTAATPPHPLITGPATRSTEGGHPRRPDPRRITVEPTPSEEWLAAVGGRKGGMPAAGRHILSAPAEVAFASGYAERGALVATARAVHTEGWLGLSVVGVTPEQRRRGWARLLSLALARWAGDRGATRAYLQVEETNEPAVTLYAGLGFTTAHTYLTYLDRVD